MLQQRRLLPQAPPDNAFQHRASTPVAGSWNPHVTPEVVHGSFVGTMSHVLDHALRNAPHDKPLPPWLQQLQAQWQAAKEALGHARGSSSQTVSTDGPGPSQSKPPRRKSSLHSLKEVLLQTKDTLLAAIRMLPRKHGDGSDDSWVYRLLDKFGCDTYKHLTDII